jgi:CHASE2 domain-containing sensor protein
MGDLATRSEMTKSLLNGVGGVGAGVGLLIVSSFASSPVLWVAAGICGVIGIGMLISKTQKKAGAVLVGAAILAGVAGIATALLGWLVPVAGIGLIALGGFSIFKFFSNMKKRM